MINDSVFKFSVKLPDSILKEEIPMHILNPEKRLTDQNARDEVYEDILAMFNIELQRMLKNKGLTVKKELSDSIFARNVTATKSSLTITIPHNVTPRSRPRFIVQETMLLVAGILLIERLKDASDDETLTLSLHSLDEYNAYDIKFIPSALKCEDVIFAVDSAHTQIQGAVYYALEEVQRMQKDTL